jgi:hypothetical protein
MTKRRALEKKTYTDFKEYERDWLTAFRQAGHKPEKQAGRIDWFAHSGGYHNGPRCTECGEGYCMHCRAPWVVAVEKCGGKAHKRRVEREAEDRTLAEAAEIRKRRRIRSKP